MSDMTVADKIKDFLVQQKTQKLAPAVSGQFEKGRGTLKFWMPDLKARGCGWLALAAATNAPAVAP